MSTAAHRSSHTLALPTPYDAGRLFAFLASRAIPGVEIAEQTDGQWLYARSLVLDGGAGSVRLRTDGRSVDVLALTTAPRDASAVLQIARRVLDLHTDPVEVDAALAEDPALAPLVAARPGLRVPGAADGYELAVRAILGQQISVARASALAGRIVAAHGSELPAALSVDDRLTHLFPAPAALAAAAPDAFPMPRSRGRSLNALGAAVDSGELDLRPDVDPAEAGDRLLALHGIGPWTVGYVRMRALADPDILLDGDLIVRRSAEALGMPGAARALAAHAARFAPWRSYVTMHLWAAYDPAPRSAR
ncbi:DNA-3-methyladenine glycosylase family protein [Cumulibacter manganitolerans]|uniref:DNA-3-methyladenine glycosylase family protein n=1 Tax=Cumulibacter manganitolerans TaxID=1884992 RepID=UPI001885CD2B|nr:DNA-3-methyladenine glycosylase 2 family protein [Cumulibacter manganitolerans]